MAGTETAQTVTNNSLRAPVNPVANRKPGARTLRRFRRHRLAMIGLVIIVVVLAAMFGREALALELNWRRQQAALARALFGTDRNGRDVFARTLVGGRVSIPVGLVAVLVSTLLGTTLGALAGLPNADFVVMRIVDMVMSFPMIVLLLAAVAIVGPGIFKIMVMVGLITWTTPARIVRAQFLQLREKEFVTAAKAVGVPTVDVAGHILPNSLAPILVYASSASPAVLLEAGLSSLGLGSSRRHRSGNILNDARSVTVFERQAWQWAPAGILCVLFVLAVNFVGDGLRDAFDPRSTNDR